MATGNNIRTYFEGTWHDGDVADHARGRPRVMAWHAPCLTARALSNGLRPISIRIAPA